MKTKNRDYILSGPILKGIMSFAVPIMIGSLVQNMFHSADMIVLGNMADDVAVASVGATGTVISLVVVTCVNLAVGTNIVLSRALGANDKSRATSIVDTSIVLAMILGVAVAIIGNLVAEPFLTLLKCPADCFDGAVLYMRIIFCGAPAQLIYNFGSSVIRSEGDSRSPLIYIIIAGAVNIVLNIVLCLLLEQKVAAVAIATVVSNVIGAVLVIRRLTVGSRVCKFNFKGNTASFSTFAYIMRFAIPTALSSAIYPIGSLQIQSAVNSFGSACVAGASAAINIENFVNACISAFTGTLVTFASHNLGAGNHQRVRKIILYSGACAFVIGLLLGSLSYHVFAEDLLSLFLPEQTEAIAYGVKRMKYVSALQWLSALNGTLAACIQAFGYPVFGTVNSLITVLAFRAVWMNFIYPLDPTIDTLYVCFSWSWLLTFIISALVFSVIYLKYLKRIKSDAVSRQSTP